MQKPAKCLLSLAKSEWIKQDFLADFAKLSWIQSSPEEPSSVGPGVAVQSFLLKLFPISVERQAVSPTNYKFYFFLLGPLKNKCFEKLTCRLLPLRAKCGQLSHTQRVCLFIVQVYGCSQALTSLFLWTGGVISAITDDAWPYFVPVNFA